MECNQKNKTHEHQVFLHERSDRSEENECQIYTNQQYAIGLYVQAVRWVKVWNVQGRKIMNMPNNFQEAKTKTAMTAKEITMYHVKRAT